MSQPSQKAHLHRLRDVFRNMQAMQQTDSELLSGKLTLPPINLRVAYPTLAHKVSPPYEEWAMNADSIPSGLSSYYTTTGVLEFGGHIHVGGFDQSVCLKPSASVSSFLGRSSRSNWRLEASSDIHSMNIC